MADPIRHSWDESGVCRQCGQRLSEDPFARCAPPGTDDEIDPTPYDMEIDADA